METLKACCPDCGKPIVIPFYRVATMQFARKCRSCGSQWIILAKPAKINSGWAHVLTFANAK